MSDEPGPQPLHWLTLAILGCLIHLCIAGGIWARVATIGPRYQKRFDDFNLALPALTKQVFAITRPQEGGMRVWVMTGLALLDLAFLVGLARWERPMVKWWFFGVLAVLLLLLWPIAELALFLPDMKLREALSR